MKSNRVLIIVIGISFCSLFIIAGVQLYQNSIGRLKNSDGVMLTEPEARIIAEQLCIKGEEAIAQGLYNPNSKTWWFDANLNSTREGCSPACVVDEETKTAEINWRCVEENQPDQITPSKFQSSKKCGIENCNGLSIVCGPKPAEMCTAIYQLGDKCRQFADCGVINGTCQQISNPQFTACKDCVETCERNFPNQPDKAFSCESTCGE